MSVEIRKNVIPKDLCRQLVEEGDKLLVSEHMVLKRGSQGESTAEPVAEKVTGAVKFSQFDKDGISKDFRNEVDPDEYVNLVRPNYEEYQGYFPPLELSNEELEHKKQQGMVPWIDAAIGHCLALVSKEMSSFYGLEIEPDQGGLVKMKTGAINGIHYDQRNPFTEEARKTLSPEQWPKISEYSFLIYLNDHGDEFTGGELVFPQHDIVIEPEAGMCVFFVGDPDHMHEVTEITSGSRYSLLGFSSEKGNPMTESRMPPR